MCLIHHLFECERPAGKIPLIIGIIACRQFVVDVFTEDRDLHPILYVLQQVKRLCGNIIVHNVD